MVKKEFNLPSIRHDATTRVMNPKIHLQVQTNFFGGPSLFLLASSISLWANFIRVKATWLRQIAQVYRKNPKSVPRDFPSDTSVSDSTSCSKVYICGSASIN
jgi:hypothetical protein